MANDVKDYNDREGDCMYIGVPSQYARRVEEQMRLQPKYCEPGPADGEMKGAHRNVQKGP
jgi:hypothetical protein